MLHILSVALQLQISLLNSKMINGTSSMTWSRGDIDMVQLLLVVKQWLLVDTQLKSEFLWSVAVKQYVRKITEHLLSAPVETEVWELEDGKNKVINPSLPNYNYAQGIGMFAVDFNFCRK